MTNKHRAVFGIYASPAEAERAVDTLVTDGFLPLDISVLMPDTDASRALAHRKETKAPEGAAAGGVLGGTLGVILALSALTIPGAGPLIAAGPIIAALAGLGAGGAVGGLLGALVGAGIPEFEAKLYEGRMQNGGVLLSVHAETDGEVLRAKELLKATGAGDITTAGETVANRKVDTRTRERAAPPR